MNKQFLRIVLTILSLASYAVDQNEVGQLRSTTTFEVVGISSVQVNTSTRASNGTAVAVGATLGALAGSKIGKGRGAIASSIVLGLLGAGVGSSVDNSLSNEQLTEVLLARGDDVRSVIVPESSLPSSLALGDHVLVVYGRDQVRLTKRAVVQPPAR